MEPMDCWSCGWPHPADARTRRHKALTPHWEWQKTQDQNRTTGNLPHVPEAAWRRIFWFALFVIFTSLAFWKPLYNLVRFSLRNESASYIVLIPLVSAYLIYLKRKIVFCNIQYSWSLGPILLALGIALNLLAQTLLRGLSQNGLLSLTSFSIVLLWIGGFVVCYGSQAYRAGSFPLSVLFLMVPIPDFLLEKAIFLLQKGSAESAHMLFKLVGVPVFREGLLFSLPGLTIEIAKECSGIRSSLVLLITCLLASYLFLRSNWARALFLLSVFPVILVKNGIRIVSLSLLGIYVNRSFLTGNLHQDGGILFFVLALVILAPLLRLLQKSENRTRNHKSERQPSIEADPVGG